MRLSWKKLLLAIGLICLSHLKLQWKNSAQILGEGSNQQPPKLRTPTQSSTPLQWLNATTSVVIENSIVKIFLNAL